MQRINFKILYFIDATLVIQSLNPLKKICLWAFMIVTNVSVAIYQLPVRRFCLFGKKVNEIIKRR